MAAVEAPSAGVEAWRELARLGVQQGRDGALAGLLGPVLDRHPGEVELWDRWARAALAGGAAAAVRGRLQGAAGRGAEGALVVLGRLSLEEGRAAHAVRVLTQGLRRTPGSTVAWAMLAWAQAVAGQQAPARAALERLGQPAGARTAELAARAWLGLREHLRAGRVLEAALARTPDDLELPLLWAALLMSLQDLDRAVAVLKRVAQRWPDEARAWANLGTAHAQAGRIHAGRAAFARLPSTPAPALRRQRAVFEATHGDPGRAVEELEDLIDTLGPVPALVQSLAHAAGRGGDHKRVLELITPLVHGGQAGANGLAAWGVAMRRCGQAAAAVAPLRQALGAARLPTEQQLLGHVLGDCLQATGALDAAFQAHAAAHEALPLRFAPRQMEEAAATIAARFPAERFAGLAPAEDAAGQPGEGVVLVVGMPRSGTSMVEQIIAAHPEGSGAGELPFLGEVVGHTGGLAGVEHLDALLASSPQERAALGRRYEALQRAHASDPGARVVVDKLPGNFLHLGAAAAVLPRARVVHCRRDALDTCLSCHFQNFSQSYAPFTRLDTLGWFYRGYAALMDHWSGCPLLPQLDLDYARTVDNLEQEVRRLLAFVGLPFHPSSVAFHRSERAMPTASYDQVRQPVYRTSLGRSRRYLAHLGPLIEALGDRAPADLR